MLGDDAANCGPEDSLEYFIREEVRGTSVVAYAVYTGVKYAWFERPTWVERPYSYLLSTLFPFLL